MAQAPTGARHLVHGEAAQAGAMTASAAERGTATHSLGRRCQACSCENMRRRRCQSMRNGAPDGIASGLGFPQTF
ncbi:hypothetical protein AAV94_05165 [Lampropedia cohaerens]|uniref:Uncharacterized protein n=1 Tax=Lampropedia cohaerens TaxID=1610491 RepID=A0A0U1Q165_9BURK|nr:hypothetical protein AAV94_05165 [Lampropedia cohaerens]